MKIPKGLKFIREGSPEYDRSGLSREWVILPNGVIDHNGVGTVVEVEPNYGLTYSPVVGAIVVHKLQPDTLYYANQYGLIIDSCPCSKFARA